MKFPSSFFYPYDARVIETAIDRTRGVRFYGMRILSFLAAISSKSREVCRCLRFCLACDIQSAVREIFQTPRFEYHAQGVC